MSNFILIETSTAMCSAALSIDGKVVSSRHSSESKAAASLLAVFIDEMLKECGLKVSDFNAVCVSSGPGSYTGLRVGVSTAKGLCFAANIPLLSVSSLDVLAQQAVKYTPVNQTIIPLIDARRMEVYMAKYKSDGERISEIESHILEADDFHEEMANGGVVLIGDGVSKFRQFFSESPITGLMAPDDEAKSVKVICKFLCEYPDAVNMVSLAEKEFAAGNFRDIAYFEPLYLKDFKATESKKKLF